MATNERDRAYAKREERLEKMRGQIQSGELVIREMTPDERARWDEHSAASDREATPEQRARREENAHKRARHQAQRRVRPS